MCSDEQRKRQTATAQARQCQETLTSRPRIKIVRQKSHPAGDGSAGRPQQRHARSSTAPAAPPGTAGHFHPVPPLPHSFQAIASIAFVNARISAGRIPPSALPKGRDGNAARPGPKILPDCRREVRVSSPAPPVAWRMNKSVPAQHPRSPHQHSGKAAPPAHMPRHPHTAKGQSVRPSPKCTSSVLQCFGPPPRHHCPRPKSRICPPQNWGPGARMTSPHFRPPQRP